MPFSVYILWSESRRRFYVGATEDIGERLECHNRGRNPSTKAGRPWILVHVEEYADRSSALARERQIKSWKSAAAIRRLVGGS